MEYKYLSSSSMDRGHDNLLVQINQLAKEGWTVCQLQAYHAGLVDVVFVLLERKTDV